MFLLARYLKFTLKLHGFVESRHADEPEFKEDKDGKKQNQHCIVEHRMVYTKGQCKVYIDLKFRNGGCWLTVITIVPPTDGGESGRTYHFVSEPSDFRSIMRLIKPFM